MLHVHVTCDRVQTRSVVCYSLIWEEPHCLMRSTSSRLMLALATLTFVLTLVAYRNLPTRGFAADDFQWLVGARSQSFGRMLRGAFDPGQNHFYRPLVWMSFWLQEHLFGLDQRGFHGVSLGLHVANALLAGWLVWKLLAQTPAVRALPALLAASIVALHPAAYEAVTWVSAQSDLLAGFWLLLLLHLWLAAAGDGGRRTEDGGRRTEDGGRRTEDDLRNPLNPLPRSINNGAFGIPPFVFRLSSSLALALALLTKESAIIGLPLLILLDLWATRSSPRTTHYALCTTHYVLPTLLTIAYLAVQLRVERANYLVDQGGYGLGPQIIFNPLRSLALLVAPLSGSENAAAAWLIPFGAIVVALLLGPLLLGRRGRLLGRILPLVALAFTLLPTAPFRSPPDSRYLYLPVIAFACMCALALREFRGTMDGGRWTVDGGQGAVVALALALALAACAETSAREARFAVAAGADNSLWQLATTICAERMPDRVIVLNTPTAEIHARAAIQLACGKKATPIFATTLAIAQANLEPNSVIIDFPGGVAHVAQRT